MTEPSLEHEAIATLDRALRQTDPLSRTMLIERALRLHRQAVEAMEDKRADRAKPNSAERRHQSG